MHFYFKKCLCILSLQPHHDTFTYEAADGVSNQKCLCCVDGNQQTLDTSSGGDFMQGRPVWITARLPAESQILS